MTNFELIKSNILSFDIGVVEYKGSSYYVLLNPLIYNNNTNQESSNTLVPKNTSEIIQDLKEMIARNKEINERNFNTHASKNTSTIIQLAIQELLSEPKDIAKAKLEYLRKIIDELVQFNNGGTEPKAALNSFHTICVNRHLYYNRPFNILLDTDIKITQNLVDDIADDLAARDEILKSLEAIHLSDIKQQSNNALSMTERDIRTLDNTLLDGELSFLIWSKITNVLDKSDTLAMPVDQMPADGKKNSCLYIFTTDVLNDQGNSIADNLKSEYGTSGVKPARIRGMLAALYELELMKVKKGEVNRSALVAALNAFFNTKFSHQIIGKNGSPTNEKDSLSKEKRIITDFLQNI